ncbi:MAG: amidase family protein [Blastocatellia bacterium]
MFGRICFRETNVAQRRKNTRRPENKREERCHRLGHKVEETKLEINGNEFIDTFLGFWATATSGLEQLVERLLGKETKRENVLEPWTVGLIDLAKSRGSEACVQRATRVFGEVTANLEKTFGSYDVILSPVMRVPPYKIGWHAPTLDFNTLLARVVDEVGYTPLHNAAGHRPCRCRFIGQTMVYASGVSSRPGVAEKRHC